MKMANLQLLAGLWLAENGWPECRCIGAAVLVMPSPVCFEEQESQYPPV